MKQFNRQTGNKGENEAVRFLKNKGYKIIERNWGNKWGEIDIIAKENETYVFVEVKTKIGDDFGFPEEMINKRKLMQVQRMGEIYSLAKDFAKRIDVVAVVLSPIDQSVTRINHYEGVY